MACASVQGSLLDTRVCEEEDSFRELLSRGRNACVKGPLLDTRVCEEEDSFREFPSRGRNASVKRSLLDTLSNNPSNQTRTLIGGGDRGVGRGGGGVGGGGDRGLGSKVLKGGEGCTSSSVPARTLSSPTNLDTAYKPYTYVTYVETQTLSSLPDLDVPPSPQPPVSKKAWTPSRNKDPHTSAAYNPPLPLPCYFPSPPERASSSPPRPPHALSTPGLGTPPSPPNTVS
jgi:hypothetical protein